MTYAIGYECDDELIRKQMGKNVEAVYQDEAIAEKVHEYIVKELIGVFARAGAFKGYNIVLGDRIDCVIRYSHFDDGEYALSIYLRTEE